MNHNDRLLFNRLIKQSNGLLVIAIITLLSILIGVIFPNPYSYNIAVSGFAIALIWGLIRNYKNKKTYDVSSIRRVFDIIGSDFGKQTKQQKASNHDAQTDIEECRKELLIYMDLIKRGLAQQP